MNKRVTIVEVNIFDRMLPLVSGYLQAYACTDPTVREHYSFQKYTTTVSSSFAQMVEDLKAFNSDVYAFSCYLWNMGLTKSIVRALLDATPRAHILLGGPQVMRHAEDYLDPERERLTLCNGEGERTFKRYLQELTRESPDFTTVGGLSFYRDRRLVTTAPEPRMHELDEIPSPFDSTIFDGEYRMAVMETNRGCPFRCSFCYWGAATNDKVYRFSEPRIRDDITWLSEHGVPLLYLADANWGMLNRDVDIARHIADCKKNRGFPFFVYFAAAKNSPERVAQIAEVFDEADMLNTQPISMQTLDDRSLERVDRKNIKLSAYERLQNRLNTKGVSSYIELIWPLPGETLRSFKSGIETLCARKAAHIIAYPHMLLHNTPLYEERNQGGLITRTLTDNVAEAELVVETPDVSYSDFKDGLRFFYVVLALYNTRVLPRLSAYLHATGKSTYAELFYAFATYCYAHGGSAFSRHCERSIEDASYYEVVNYPTVYHIVLHESRAEFEELLYRFASHQRWWTNSDARLLFEVDMLSKPYLYSNTPIRTPSFALQHVRLVDVAERSIDVELPEGLSALVEDGQAAGPWRINHKRFQQPYNQQRNLEENASYCSGAVMRVGDILPTWSKLEHDT